MTFTRSRRVRNPLEKHSKVGELPRRVRRRHWPIFLEALEDRTLLSIFTEIATTLGNPNTGLAAVQRDVSGILNSAQSLPLVGKTLGDFGAANTFSKFKTTLANALDKLADSATDGDIRTALSNALASAGVTLDSIGTIGGRGESGGGPDQVSVAHPAELGAGGVAIEMHLHLAPTTAPVTFSTGFAALPFSVHATVTPQITFDYELAFQYNANTGQTTINNGAHLNDFDASGVDHTLEVDVGATHTGGFTGNASIGLVQGTLSDNGSSLVAHFGADNLLAAQPALALSGSAKISLHLKGGLSGATAATFPSISTDFNLGWTFGSSPTVSFDNVTVDMGTFLSGIVDPILQKIQYVTAPLESVLDVLTTPLPGISDLSRYLGQGSVTLLSLAKDVGNEAGYGALVDLVGNIADLIQTADGIDVSQGTLLLHLGGFNVDPTTLAITGSQAGSGVSNTSSVGMSQAASNFIANLTQPKATFGLDFPIFDDPEQGAFKLLLGQDADLVRFDADVTNLTFDSGQLSGLSLAGVGLEFSGNVTLNAHLGLAYDTFGLRELITSLASGSPPDAATITSDISDGFYVDAGPGPGGSNVEVSGKIGAAIGFSFGIFSLSVGGAVETGNDGHDSIGITLQDDPAGSGKLRFGDISVDAIVGNGQLDAGITANIQIGVTFLGTFYGYSQDFGFGSTVLLDLGTNTPFYKRNTPKQILAKMDTGVPGQLDLLLGTRAGERQVQDYSAHDIAGTQDNGDENYTITHLWDDVGGGETVMVSAFDVTEQIDGVKSIYGRSDMGNLTVNIDPGVEAILLPYIIGGRGTASLTYSGSGSAPHSRGRARE